MAEPASLTCTENIALFHLLHAGRGKDKVLSKDSVPVRPSVAPVDCLPTHRKDYTLSFERERSLAGALAYISNIKDDPNRVAAICVEENRRQRGKPSLRILLAVNRSNYMDGDDFLQILETGFKSIFAELSQVVDDCKLLYTHRILRSAAEYYDIILDDDQVVVEGEMRRLIISMCSSRILNRLHFKKRKIKRTPNQPAREKFQNVIRALAPHGATKLSFPAKVSDEERTTFIERAKDIIGLIDAYTNHPRPQQLEDLVYGFYRLGKVDCQAIVNGIPDNTINQSGKNSLMNMIRKVARYSEVARFLFRTAKKFPIVRRMQVKQVSLPENAFLRTPVDSEYKLSLSSILLRITGPQKAKLSGQRCETDTICPLLSTNTKQADDDLTAQTCRTLTTGKIHAEVQLVFYCETLKKLEGRKAGLLSPRVVCSSKKACFLCNLLVGMQGQMQTPWCHGKLYPGWRLPVSSSLDLPLRFNRLLEDRIMESILLLFKRRGKTAYPGPSESTLITLPSLASEVGIAPRPTHDDQVSLKDKQTEEVNKNVQAANGAVQYYEGPISSAGPLPATEDLIGKLSGEGSQPAESSSDSQHPSSLRSSEAQSIAEEDVQRIERTVKAQTAYAGTEKEAQAGQSTSTSKDHIDSIKPDFSLPESQHRPEISEDHTKFPDIGGRSSQPHKPCRESVISVDGEFHLQRGQKQYHTIQPKQTSPFYTTTSLEVQLEYSTGPSIQTAAGKHANELSFSVERLAVNEIAKLKDHGIVPIVDAEAMLEDIPEIPLVMPKLSHLYIACKEDVFKITLYSRTESSSTSHQCSGAT